MRADEESELANQRENNAPEAMEEEEAPRDPAQQFLITKSVILKLCDLDSLQEEEEVSANIALLAELVLGDEVLRNCFEEMRALCLSLCAQLSVQIPVVVALLSKFHAEMPSFSQAFLLSLQQETIARARAGETVTAKLFLKTFACLASAGVLAVSGRGGLEEILLVLLRCVEEETLRSASDALSEQACVFAYLLANTMPYALEALASPRAFSDSVCALVARVEKALNEVLSRYRSPFAAHGRRAVLSRDTHTHTAEGEAESEEDFVGLFSHTLAVSDSLCDAVRACLYELSVWQRERERYVVPACVLSPWRDWATESDAESTSTPSQQLSVGEEWCESLREALTHGLLCESAECAAALGVTDESVCVRAPTARERTRERDWLRARVQLFFVEDVHTLIAQTRANEPTYSRTSPVREGEAEKEKNRVFTATEKHTVLAAIQDVLLFFAPRVCADGTLRGSVDTLLRQLISVKKLLRPAAGYTPLHHTFVDYLLVESLLAQCLQTPRESALLVQSTRLLLALCKQSQSLFPQIYAQGVHRVYTSLAALSFNSVRGFSDTFGTYCANTNYSWPYWSVWEEESGLRREGDAHTETESEDEKCARIFLSLSLRRALALSKRPTLTKHVPASLAQHCVPPHDQLCLHYLSGRESSDAEGKGVGYPEVVTAEMREAAQRVQRIVQDRGTASSLLDYLEAVVRLTEDERSHQCVLAQIVCEALAVCAHRDDTLTALYALVERYRETLCELADDEDTQVLLIHTVWSTHAHNETTQRVFVEQLLRERVVTAAAVARYLSRSLSAPKSSLADCLTHSLCDAPPLVRLAARESDLGAPALCEALAHHTLRVLCAAVEKRAMAGDGARLDMPSAELAPCEMPVYASHTQPTDDSGATPEEDESLRRTRARLSDSNEAQTMTASEREIDPLWLADEALKSALLNTRTVHRLLVSHCVELLSLTHTSLSAPTQAFLRNVALSLLSEILRAYALTQRALVAQVAGSAHPEVVLADEEVRVALRAALQGECPEMCAAWARFL